MRWAIFLISILIFAFATPVMAADAELGEKIFKRRCKVCHNQTYVRKVGPGLLGVVGREAESGIGTLTEARINEWIQNPRSIKPNTRMPKYNDMQDAEKRAAVIDYLKTLK
ncbi:MAG: c-type cytochrome [Mariprofundaceae bacterium]